MKFSTRDLCFCAIGAGAHRRVRMDQHPGGRAVHAADLCDLRRVRAARRQARYGERAGVSAAGCGGRAGICGLSRRVRVPDRHDRGYLVGFILLALIIALAQARWGLGQWVFVLSAAVGLLVCYAFGTAWFLIVYTRTGAITLGVVLAKCVLPFLLPDAVKLALATLLRARLYRRIPA